MAKAQTKPGRKPALSTVKKRNRRAPADLLADLQAKRDSLAKRLGDRLAKLDARIAKVETKYDRQIQLAELTEGLSADEIADKLEETRNMQRLLRLAMRTKS